MSQKCPQGHGMIVVEFGSPTSMYDYYNACTTCGHREFRHNPKFKGPKLDEGMKFVLGLATSLVKEANKQMKVEAERIAREMVKKMLGRGKKRRRK